VLTNNDLQLSPTQLLRYNEWAGKVATAHAHADASESLSITLSFSFCFLSKTVKAAVDGGQQVLILEDCIE
jgi:hypothetical protein